MRRQDTNDGLAEYTQVTSYLVASAVYSGSFKAFNITSAVDFFLKQIHIPFRTVYLWEKTAA